MSRSRRSPGFLLLALVPLLGGCGEGGEEAEPAAASFSGFCDDVLARVDSFFATAPEPPDDPRYGGTAVVGAIGEMADGMNALVSADYSATQHQQNVNLMTLIRYDADLEPAPYLAESWEVNDDLTELTFHLRDDVVWHDGTPTTAHDVAFTYRRATNPETGFPNAAFWTHYATGEGAVEVMDSFTLRIGMEPHAEYMDPWRTLAVMPEHLLGDVPPAQLRQHPYGTRCPVGNGPFRFIDHRQDERWTFEANPFFPEGLGGRPYLDRLVYRVIVDETTLLTELLTEGIDVYSAPNPDQAEDIRNSDATDFEHYLFRNVVFVGWNTRRPQLSDPRVRRAITMATDRRRIVEAIRQGYGRIANTGVPPFHWAYDPSLEDAVPHDPDGARALLDEAGWSDRDGDGVRENADGVELSFGIKYNQGNQTRRDIAQIMQSQLSGVGIDASPRVVEWATLVDQVMSERREFDGVVLGWVVEFKLDDRDLFHSEAADERYGWAGIRDDRLDHLLDTLQLVVDREEAKPLWREYQRRIVELQPYTYMYFGERLDGVNKRIRGEVMDIRGEWINASEWWIPEDERFRQSRTAEAAGG